MTKEALSILRKRREMREDAKTKEIYSNGRRLGKVNHPGSIYWPTAMRTEKKEILDTLLEGTVGSI